VIRARRGIGKHELFKIGDVVLNPLLFLGGDGLSGHQSFQLRPVQVGPAVKLALYVGEHHASPSLQRTGLVAEARVDPALRAGAQLADQPRMRESLA